MATEIIKMSAKNLIQANYSVSSSIEDALDAIALKNCKAMKSSPLLGPFCGSEFLGFSLLKIYLYFKLETKVSSALIHSTLLSS